MDDFTDKINSILSDPKMMEQIKGLSGLFSDKQEKENIKHEPKHNECIDTPDLPNDTMQIVMKMVPLLSSINKDDDSTRLLHALKPFLASERKKKLDEAIKMMQLLKLLPLIKGSGIL